MRNLFLIFVPQSPSLESPSFQNGPTYLGSIRLQTYSRSGDDRPMYCPYMTRWPTLESLRLWTACIACRVMLLGQSCVPIATIWKHRRAGAVALIIRYVGWRKSLEKWENDITRTTGMTVSGIRERRKIGRERETLVSRWCRWLIGLHCGRGYWGHQSMKYCYKSLSPPTDVQTTAKDEMEGVKEGRVGEGEAAANVPTGSRQFCRKGYVIARCYVIGLL